MWSYVHHPYGLGHHFIIWMVSTTLTNSWSTWWLCAMDFISPLPEDNGNNCVITFTNCLGSNIQLAVTHMNIYADELASIFFGKWYCENSLPSDIVFDRNNLFISKFWKTFHKLMGVKLKLSTAYHPQTDSMSKQTNKTTNQCLCYHVKWNQHGWSHVLPRIHFHMMKTINTSTGFTLFQLWMGQSPQLIPPLLALPQNSPPEDISVCDVICKLQDNAV